MPQARAPILRVADDSPEPPGSYKLVKSGVEKGYQLLYRKPSFKKDGK
jgi:hypothetical protein